MWMKNLITTCFFHVDEFLCPRFYFSEKSLFWDDQYGRCVRGFWRQILVYTLLTGLIIIPEGVRSKVSRRKLLKTVVVLPKRNKI